ncbi:MAG: L-carnitine dehydratase/bile acid-inducible protein [Ramlibacter sp.]|nr:L-carnitine dehydratase/bile acid-inducible protein [Ramlibacter sp.]
MSALQGVKVLDLSRVLAGPWATQMLGDLGADVVKVERPGTGDDTRAWGPPWVEDAEKERLDVSAYFTCANRNKRSVAIDLANGDGQELVRQLAAQADVLVENFKVGGLKQYGLDHETLRKSNRGLIYCSITGFGQTGPYAQRPGYDFLIQGMGGLMSVTGRPDTEPGGGPMKVGVALVDLLTGLYASNAILAALQHRNRTGEGQYIDVALLDVQVAALANQAANYLVGERVPSRMGNAHPNIVPYQDFPTADGYMILTVGNDGQFARFCEAAGHPEWSVDPRFLTNAARVVHRDALLALLRSVTMTRPTREWVRLLEEAGVPCGPINDIAQVFSDPHVIARGLQVQVPHGEGADIHVVANPLRLSATPVAYRLGPPVLGAHTQEVLDEWLQAGGSR